MSPALSVKPSERLSIIAGILKIILLVLLSCFFSLFKNSLILRSLGSKSVKYENKSKNKNYSYSNSKNSKRKSDGKNINEK